MWRWWDPLEKSTWNLPSGPVMLIIKSDRYCTDKLEKKSVSFHSPTLALIFSTHTMLFTGTPSRAFPPKSHTNLITLNPKEFIQDNFLFTVPKVLPLAWTCWLKGKGYVFFYRLHPQFVLFISKHSTTELVLPHPLIEDFFFPWIMLENLSHRTKYILFFKEDKEWVKTTLPLLLDSVN